MQGKSISGYTLQRPLGTGGMAEVWYAENKIGKKAAVKLLLPKLCQDENVVSRFLTEAKVMVDLNHPNIRQVYDYGDIEGRPAIVMEYLDGDDLKARMKRGQRFTDEELKGWWNQLVVALNYTHSKGIIHRDIKPGNIFVDREGNIKLLDFGIAKVRESISSTQTGQKLGTLMYMSPEQVKDSKHIDYRTDVYSLAVTYVHLLTGKKPYDSDTSSDFEISEQIVYKPLDLSGVPEDWRAFLTPYLNKEPDQRPALRPFENVAPAATETVEQSEDEGTIVGAVPPKPAQKKPESKPTTTQSDTDKPKSKKGLWIGLGVAVAAVAALLVLLLGTSSNDEKKQSSELVAENASIKPLPYHLNHSLILGSFNVKVRNVMSINLDQFGKLLINGRIVDKSNLKDVILDFITPKPADEYAPEVETMYFDAMGNVLTTKGVVGLFYDQDDTEKQELCEALNEIAKAYAEARERLSMNKFNKQLGQLDSQQIEAIREAVPVRVIGVGEYMDVELAVWEDNSGSSERVEDLEINNAFVETCMLKLDDWRGIQSYLDDFMETPVELISIQDQMGWNEQVEEEMVDITPSEQEIFQIVEEMPQFPGGEAKLMEYIGKNIKYPQKARETGIQGRVFISFVVEPDGSVSNVKLLRGIGGGCDEEAMRVVKSMPKWKPGKQRGKAVRVSYQIPVFFKLTE